MTSVEAGWLLDGKGPKFPHTRGEPSERALPPTVTVGALMKSAVQLLGRGLQVLEDYESTTPRRNREFPGPEHIDGVPDEVGLPVLLQDRFTGDYEESADTPAREARTPFSHSRRE